MRFLFAPSLLLLAAACATTGPGSTVNESEDKPPIVQAGAPVLRERAAEVPPEEIATPEFQALLSLMVDAMRKAPGVGLAAPQLGVGKRVFVLEDKEELMGSLSASERLERERVVVPLRVIVNPVVTPVGEDKVTFFEGCLSVAGFAALVTRAREVEVTGLDEHAQPVSLRVKGWPARILQHEMDHLDGTLYIDRMHTRSFGTLPQVKERFAGKPIAEVLKTFDL